jgi:hypothetical protein
MLVWYIAACVVSIVSSLILTGKTPWHGLVDFPSWQGTLAAILLFLLMQAIGAVFMGTPCVALSLAVFHVCARFGLGCWIMLAVIIANVLLGALIFWQFIGTLDEVERFWWTMVLPPIVATLVTGVFVAIRE